MSLIQESFERSVTLKIFQTLVTPGPNGGLGLQQIDPIGKAFNSRQDDGSPGFHIKFTIDKVIEVTPNPTSIFIYNLGPTSREFLRTNSIVVLEAGYVNDTGVIFHGNLSRARTRREGTDYVTQIEAADGLFAVQNSRINASFQTAVPLQGAIATLVGALSSSGVTPGQVIVPNPDVYNSGLVFSGKTVDLLQEVCEKADLDFSIQDGKVIILPSGSPMGAPVFLVAPETGLIGIPEKRDVGVSFKMLLSRKVTPFQPILLKSKFLNGLYTAAKVRHLGDSSSGEFYTEVEAA